MSILSQIGYSGVRASQVALTTTGQNIANVNTPGFSRLNPVFGSLAGQGGRGFRGGGEFEREQEVEAGRPFAFQRR